ncbi:MAG: hypothetical protein Q9173_005828 [Seirophora scorigena]
MGQYIMQAAGQPDYPEAIRGIAVAALTGACLIHGLWRNGGIVLNNVLAIIKILTLMAVIVIGFAVAGGASFGNGPTWKSAVKENFIPKNRILDSELDMANIFFQDVFGNEIAPRVMSGIISLSIFGNIVVMTFTASKAVKQEIAKEGILPFSLFFARSTTTPYAWLKHRFWRSDGGALEQSPATALGLHWVFAIIMVAATSSTTPSVAFIVLVLLYAYLLVVVVGFFVASGVLYLRFTKKKEWTDNLGFQPWGGPTAAIIYSCTCAFMIVGVFITPGDTSPFSYATTGVRHYIVPTVGLCTLLIGYSYYLVFAKLIPRVRKKVLVVEREPIIVRQGGRQDGEWVQILEVVEFWWAARHSEGKEA